MGVGSKAHTVIPAFAEMTVTELYAARGCATKSSNGQAELTAELAIRFEKAFGLKADTLCKMQTAYELAKARAVEDTIKGQAAGRSGLTRIYPFPLAIAKHRFISSHRSGPGRWMLSALACGFQKSQIAWIPPSSSQPWAWPRTTE